MATREKPSVWMEISKGTIDHGGSGWELGTCLWSPTTRQWGGYRYMLDPVRGDHVVHCYEGILVGSSKVEVACVENRGGPPNPGRWKGMNPFFRIELTGYQEFPQQIALKKFVAESTTAIRNEIESSRPRKYPFCIFPTGTETTRITTIQGRMVALITPKLLSLICDATHADVSAFEK